MTQYDDDAARLGDLCDLCQQPIIQCECEDLESICPRCEDILMYCDCTAEQRAEVLAEIANDKA